MIIIKLLLLSTLIIMLSKPICSVRVKQKLKKRQKICVFVSLCTVAGRGIFGTGAHATPRVGPVLSTEVGSTAAMPTAWSRAFSGLCLFVLMIGSRFSRTSFLRCVCKNRQRQEESQGHVSVTLLLFPSGRTESSI